MHLILIRGLPGSGKSIIADKLHQKLEYSKVIHIDDFKKQYLQTSSDFEAAKIFAYEKTQLFLKEFVNSKIKIIILEELFYESNFVNQIKKTAPNYILIPIRIIRPMSELLEIDSKRNRKIKNTEQDFINIQEGMLKIKFDSEIIIQNSLSVDIQDLIEGLISQINI